MRTWNIFAAAVLAFGLGWGSARAQDAAAPPAASGQQSDPGKPASQSSSSKTKSKATKSKAPPPPPSSTEKSAAPDASQPKGTPDAPQPSAAPDAPQPSAAKKPSTADDNPFPEDVSRKAAADAKADASSSAPAAKPSQDSSSRDGMDKLGPDDGVRQQLKLQSPDGSGDVYDPKRATEDVRVGKFYLSTGDVKGAYDRFKDATVFDHEDAEAVFWLAEAARKMNLPQEALQNYQVYLEAVPDGPNAKVARKALGELASGSGKAADQHP